ncbi:thioester domain-containing protein [Arthrobacter yangruifuii]|uniref:thioester domain-containing protein n=1 Tax=Arthrobacter yangruifuii TaxID=2606616 RepID=UPI0011B45FBA|nr:thioester domain-containing protein [Arthrobacter yangruifuii]
MPTSDHFAGIITTADVNDPTAVGQMYCINIRVVTTQGVGYVNGTWEESNVPNIGYVNYILNNYYPANPAAPADLSPDQQAAAVQAAIWYFTDGYLVNTAQTDIRPAVEAIVADAQANGPLLEPPAPDVTITPASAAAPVGSPAGPYTVAAEGAAELSVSVPTGYTMYTDAAGTAPLANPSTVPSGTQIWVGGPPESTTPGVLSARASVTVQTGSVYLYDRSDPGREDAQRLILAVTTDLNATAQATAEFFALGSLLVTKSFVGEGAGNQGASQLVVDCGAPNVFTIDVPPAITEDFSSTVGGIPAGSTCTVTEPVTGSNATVSVTTTAPATVVVPEEGASVTVTNTVEFNPGSLTVLKVLTGAAAGLQGEITVTVSCDAGIEQTLTIPAGSAAGDYAGTITDIPAGAMCTVTEPQSGATDVVTVSTVLPAVVTIQPGLASEAVVTNDVAYTYGSLVVTKTLTGPGAGQQGDIRIMVTCGDTFSQEILIPAGTAAGQQVSTLDRIPAGSSCVVTEPATGENASVTVDSILPGEVVVLGGTSATAELTNTYSVLGKDALAKTGASGVGWVWSVGIFILALGSLLVVASFRRRVM